MTDYLKSLESSVKMEPTNRKQQVGIWGRVGPKFWDKDNFPKYMYSSSPGPNIWDSLQMILKDTLYI